MNSGEGHLWTADSLPIIEPDFLANILPEVADIALVVDSHGQIHTALSNPNETAIRKIETWVGRNLSDLLTEECLPKLHRMLEQNKTGSPVLRVELNHKENTETWQYPVRYSVHYTDNDDGTILMLGRDLRHVAETQQQLVQAQIALEQSYEERREFDARYRMLMTVSREAFVLVEVSSGLIRDLNEAAASLLGDTREALQGHPFASEFKDRSRLDFIENMSALAASEADSSVRYITRKTQTDLTIEPVSFRAGGERMLICRLETETHDRHISEELSENLALLFRNGPEAIVFADKKGVIKQANKAFLRIVDFAHQSEVEGGNIADSLFRGQVDLNVLLNNCARVGGMRGYATKLCNDVGVCTPVEVSAVLLKDKTSTMIGMVFRDVSRKDATSGSSDGVSTFSRGNVVDLVGSASLKEIVSQTTDVIERMCIETAIELTGNNRAAAAEMLGLSRQSLYVKLNKFMNQDKSSGS